MTHIQCYSPHNQKSKSTPINPDVLRFPAIVMHRLVPIFMINTTILYEIYSFLGF
ncbi:MAG: hypothetical protein NHB15_05890 [Methanosarcina barkeri]|nr:hypothetical protein [Methanosarcina sp. ERenArc_MAG2]